MKLWSHKYIHVSRRAERVLAGMAFKEVRSIAVIKHAALGDMVLTRPFFVTLRQHFPFARVTLSAVENYLQALPRDLVDRVHVSAGKSRPRPPFLQRQRRYRELGYHDLLFDLPASSDSYWITAVNPARLKVGFRHSPHARLLYDVAIPRGIFTFEAENFLAQLAVLRIRYDWPLRFDWPRLPGTPARRYVLYFPTASVAVKCWPAERYGALLGRMASTRPELEHLLMYGVADWEVASAEQALAAAGGERDNLRAERDARGEQFQRLIQQATLVISNDTGIRNVAIAAGTPTLGIFPVGLVYTYLPRFGYHETVHEPEGGHPTVDAVFTAALALLGRIEGAAR